MAVSLSYIGVNGPTNAGTHSLALTVLPTGSQCILLVESDYGANNPDFSSFSLSTDGAAVAIADGSAAGARTAYLLFWSNITTASQTLTWSNAGQNVEASVRKFSCSGVDAATPLGTALYDSAGGTMNFTVAGANDLTLTRMWGASTGSTFSEGSWTAAGAGGLFWANLTAGTKAINITNAAPDAHSIFQILAGSGGGGGGVPKSTKFLMTGIG